MLDTLNMVGGYPRYPESGPGPITLKHGTLELGFFGEVTSSELLTTQELSEQAQLSVGTVWEAYPVWLKFAHLGKFLFIPKTPLKYAVSWQQIYDAGLVYGIEDTTNTESLKTSLLIPQFTLVEKDAHRFLVRLPRGAKTNPVDLSTSGTARVADPEVEYEALFFNLVNNTLNDVFYRLDKYTISDLHLIGGAAGRTLVQEHNTALTHPWTVGYGNVFDAAIRTQTSASTYHAWRPVLELISKDYLLPQNAFHYRVTGVFVPMGALSVQISQVSPATLMPLSNANVQVESEAFILSAMNLEYSANDMLLPLSESQLQYERLSHQAASGVVATVHASEEESLLRPIRFVYGVAASTLLPADTPQGHSQVYDEINIATNLQSLVEGEALFRPYRLSGGGTPYWYKPRIHGGLSAEIQADDMVYRSQRFIYRETPESVRELSTPTARLSTEKLQPHTSLRFALVLE